MAIFYSPTTRGFYDDNIHTSFPSDAIEIAKQLYDDLLIGQSQGGEIAVANGMPAIVQPPTPDLDQTKERLKTAVDQSAETLRLRYITPGVGQAMTYTQKAEEAARFLAATNPSAADFPLLSAEVGITAPDIIGVATAIKYAYGQWQTIGALIEKTRLGTKAAIAAAVDAEGAVAVFNAVTWPT